jgi:hypothetical protein
MPYPDDNSDLPPYERYGDLRTIAHAREAIHRAQADWCRCPLVCHSLGTALKNLDKAERMLHILIRPVRRRAANKTKGTK